ncbi:natterin-3-like isoform X2 [Syngnathus scovelli]|uniref:natterin-3-like isoform X2 n=1 Tax=Syngnathus scovelli TaxID=161590 RepID=UPI00210F88FC|nr:natterin-3-like isoform X2 [Syngnathus scovelli]
MAKLWVPFLLLALMHLTSCASIDNCDQQPSSSALANLHPAVENKYPEQPPQSSPLRPSSDFLKEAQDAPSADFDETNLEWKRWAAILPDGAVSIYNSYSSRIDYICKVGCHSGYYDSTLSTPACAYTADGAGYTAEHFDVLVNKDEFEILQWKNGYRGSVSPNSIKTCVNEDAYVGKNQYGLGEVKVSEKVFYLPWGGSRYKYDDYQVLETMKDVKREHLMEVKYLTEGITPIEYPPEVLNKATLANKECKPIKNEMTLTKTVATTRKWEINFSVTVGVGITIETGIPFIVNGNIDFKAAFTYRLTKETTYTDTTTHTLTLETRVPPGHSCTVKMQGKKYGLDIPYTARLKRVYRNGETKWTTVTGTFKGVEISEVEAEMERCELLPDVKPC